MHVLDLSPPNTLVIPIVTDGEYQGEPSEGNVDSFGGASPGDFKDLKTARDNGAKILWVTTSIEKQLDELIGNFFFPAGSKRRDLFVNEMLQAPFFSFSAKKNLVSTINTKIGKLSGKDRNHLQSDLKKIMDARNAFAHGKIEIQARKGVTLSYYQGKPETKRLRNDEFWQPIESAFKRAEQLLKHAIQHAKAYNEHSS